MVRTQSALSFFILTIFLVHCSAADNTTSSATTTGPVDLVHKYVLLVTCSYCSSERNILLDSYDINEMCSYYYRYSSCLERWSECFSMYTSQEIKNATLICEQNNVYDFSGHLGFDLSAATTKWSQTSWIASLGLFFAALKLN